MAELRNWLCRVCGHWHFTSCPKAKKRLLDKALASVNLTKKDEGN